MYHLALGLLPSPLSPFSLPLISEVICLISLLSSPCGNSSALNSHGLSSIQHIMPLLSLQGHSIFLVSLGIKISWSSCCDLDSGVSWQNIWHESITGLGNAKYSWQHCHDLGHGHISFLVPFLLSSLYYDGPEHSRTFYNSPYFLGMMHILDQSSMM